MFTERLRCIRHSQSLSKTLFLNWGFEMKNLIRYALLLGLILLPGLAGAQIDRSELNGTVTDSTGASVGGVTVTVTQSGTNQVRVATTDGRGQFVVSSLPIGRFTLVFARNG